MPAEEVIHSTCRRRRNSPFGAIVLSGYSSKLMTVFKRVGLIGFGCEQTFL